MENPEWPLPQPGPGLDAELVSECSPQNRGKDLCAPGSPRQAVTPLPAQDTTQSGEVDSSGRWVHPRPQVALVLSPQENHKLRDQNDDLNGQILSLSLYEAKNLFATQTKAQSLAAEIDTASRDEVALPSHS